jgi:hypothetical protein
MFKLEPNPGVLPTRPAPCKGEKLYIRVDGLPPYKELRASIRNLKHRHHSRFVALRDAAIAAMDGRAWSIDAIKITLVIHAPNLDKDKMIADYLSGVLDTVDGSHGESFTYLPVCFQDDCQVVSCRTEHFQSSEPFYELEICFELDEQTEDNSTL